MLRGNAATLWAHVIWRSGTTVPNSQSHPIPWSTQFHCKGINSVQYSNWQLFSEYQKGATPCLLCKMKVLGNCCDLHVTDTTSQQRWIIFPLPMIVFTIHLEGRYGVIPSNISACKSRRVIEATADYTNQFGDELFLAILYCPHHNRLTWGYEDCRIFENAEMNFIPKTFLH